MAHPVARLKTGFLDHLAATGLTDSAAAAAIGVTKQYFSQVKTGIRPPSIAFMSGAILAGLASSFDDVAELARDSESQAAA